MIEFQYFKILYKKIMFQSSVYGKKEDKICSISDFQSSESFSVPVQQSIENKVIDLVKQSSHRIRYKPVYIISPNFRAKHITMLTLLLQRQGIPIQYQHETDSLGEEVNRTFFVVVDNKAGSLALGKDFDSELITVVGYPRKGSNKRNIYCKQPQQVYQEYMMFAEKSSNKGYQKKLEEKLNKLEAGNKIRERRGSIFGSNNSNIKLKSISKYDRNLQHGVLKGSAWDKQNVKSKRRIETIQTERKGLHSNQTSNLHILESDQNQSYNRTVREHYQELKTQENRGMVKLYKNQEQLISDLTGLMQSNPGDKLKDKRKFHYIIVSYQIAMKLATRVNSQLYLMKGMVRLVVVIFEDHNLDKIHYTSKENHQEIELLVVQKAMKSDLFWCIVCGNQQLSKVLTKTGFQTRKKLNQHNSHIKTTLKSRKKVLIQQKSQHEISEDIISFCPEKQAKSFKTIDKNSSTKIQKSSGLHPVEKKDINRSNVRLQDLQISAVFEKQHENSRMKLECRPKSKIKIIPAINSMLSPGKSSVSSKQSPSKIRFMKVTKKSNVSQNNSQIREDKHKNLAEANSQYCIDKNRGIVQRLQSRIQESRRSISSRKSLRSINGRSQRSIRNGSQMPVSERSSIKLRDSVSVEYGRGSSDVRGESGKFINDGRTDQYSKENTYNRPLGDQKKQVRKLRMNVDQNQDFVAQCSQLSILTDYQASQRKIQNLILDKNQKQVKRKVSSNILSANEYYFGAQNAVQKRWQQQQTFSQSRSVIDGLLYIQYNSLISGIMEKFRVECPQRLIEKQKMRRFYLAREYSRELRRLWSCNQRRGILPVLVDLQGLGEVVKYYGNVMYDDDQMGFCSRVTDNSLFKKSGTDHFQYHGNSAILPQFTDDNRPILIILFTIVSEQEQQHQVFNQLDLLSTRLPRHQIIKCVISQEVLRDDKLSSVKSRQIYQQMIEYFLELSEDYGERVVGTV